MDTNKRVTTPETSLNHTTDQFIDMQNSEHTKRAYRLDLDKWFAFLGDREPSIQTALEFREFLIESVASGSALRTFTTVRSYYHWLGGDNPFERVKAPKRLSGWVPVVPSDDSVNAVMDVCDSGMERAILACLANGLRAQEVCDLSVEDFYLDPDYDRWILRVTGKGQKLRLVPVNDETAEALIDVLPARGRVFRSLNPRKVHYIVEKLAKRAGVAMHPHALRHNYATRLVRAGADVFSLQGLLGHARPETTGVYVNLNLSDLVNTSRLDPRNERA